MKSEKGVTLISVTIYVIVMAMVVGIMAVISTFFYSNVNDINEVIDPITEFTKLNSYLSEEVNHSNIKILECKDNYIVFDNGVQYTFVAENKGIYRNQVKIAQGVTACSFSETIKNGKNVVEVKVKMGDKERNTTYTLKN